MPRLFWKLFGTFWLTTVLILAISIFVSFRLADEDASARPFIDPREADALLRDVLRDEGIDGLRAWIGDAGNFPAGQTVYVVDESGNELLGRPVPEFLRARLRRMWALVRWREGRDGERPPRRRMPRRFAPFLRAPDGTRLLAIPGPAPVPRFGVLAESGMRWAVLGLAAATSLASFWLLSRSLTRPAQRISRTVGRLAEGDMSARVGSAGYSNDEIGALARQFDRMAEELEAQSRTRQDLFRNISHELRAPLARLQIATELLERKPQQSAGQLQRIRNEIGVLEQLTAQVLALARAAQEEGSQGTATLAAVIDRVAGNAELEADRKGIDMRWDRPPDDLRVKATESLLASAIENVVRNAIQHTPAGGTVGIHTERRDGRLRLRVSDTGPGVPEAELERIFEPFYRLDTNRPGSGIGLAITARVLRRIGGTVRARNADGGGLVVTLEMPVA